MRQLAPVCLVIPFVLLAIFERVLPTFAHLNEPTSPSKKDAPTG